MLCYVVFVLCIFNILTSTSLRAVFKGKQLLNKVGLWQKAFSGAQDFLQILLQLWKFGQSPFTPAHSFSSYCCDKMRRRVIFDSYSSMTPFALLVSQKIRITSPLTVFLKYGQLNFSKASDSIECIFVLTYRYGMVLQVLKFHSPPWQGKTCPKVTRSHQTRLTISNIFCICVCTYTRVSSV